MRRGYYAGCFSYTIAILFGIMIFYSTGALGQLVQDHRREITIPFSPSIWRQEIVLFRNDQLRNFSGAKEDIEILQNEYSSTKIASYELKMFDINDYSLSVRRSEGGVYIPHSDGGKLLAYVVYGDGEVLLARNNEETSIREVGLSEKPIRLHPLASKKSQKVSEINVRGLSIKNIQVFHARDGVRDGVAVQATGPYVYKGIFGIVYFINTRYEPVALLGDSPAAKAAPAVEVRGSDNEKFKTISLTLPRGEEIVLEFAEDHIAYSLSEGPYSFESYHGRHKITQDELRERWARIAMEDSSSRLWKPEVVVVSVNGETVKGAKVKFSGDFSTFRHIGNGVYRAALSISEESSSRTIEVSHQDYIFGLGRSARVRQSCAPFALLPSIKGVQLE